LFLNETQVTDAGLIHLKEIVQLRILVLKDTKITDAGWRILQRVLADSKSCPLRILKVTDAGCQEMEKALPKLYIDR